MNEILMHFRTSKNIASEISIYDPVETEKGSNTVTILDTLAASDETSCEVELRTDCQKLYRALQQLDIRSRRVIAMRYGLNGNAPCTQKQVAQLLGISRSYVSRIEKAALETLKKAL